MIDIHVSYGNVHSWCILLQCKTISYRTFEEIMHVFLVSIRICLFQDRLLKPLGGYVGYNSEWRELAQIINRVSPQSNSVVILHCLNHLVIYLLFGKRRVIVYVLISI